MKDTKNNEENKCLYCKKEIKSGDWCSAECRRCLKCSDKMSIEDDMYCVICSMGC